MEQRCKIQKKQQKKIVIFCHVVSLRMYCDAVTGLSCIRLLISRALIAHMLPSHYLNVALQHKYINMCTRLFSVV